MKKILLVICFVVMLTGSAFADYGLPSEYNQDIPSWVTDDYYYACVNVTDGSTSSRQDDIGEYYILYGPEPITYNNEILKCVANYRSKLGFMCGGSSGEWGNGGSIICTTDSGNMVYGDNSPGGIDYAVDVVWSSHDIVDESDGSVFFSAVSPVEKLPGMVIPQVAIVAGAGILLISLTLLPGLLKKLWAFL